MTESVYRRSTSFHVQILQQVTCVFTLCFQRVLLEAPVSAAYSFVQRTRTTCKEQQTHSITVEGREFELYDLVKGTDIKYCF